MTNQSSSSNSRLVDTWLSISALPLWVIIWLLILFPINMGILFFLDQPSAPFIAALVFVGLFLSAIVAFYHRGMSRLVGAGHIIGWTPLVLMIAFAKPEGSAAYGIYLTVLLIGNLISLVFDFIDAARWLRGDREVPNDNLKL